VLELLAPLLQDDGFSHTNWVTNLSNTSSLLYHCFMSYADAYGTTETGEAVVNWCGASSVARLPRADFLAGNFHARD
jgi:hypothetical protein